MSPHDEAHEGHEANIVNSELRTTIVESLRSLRKFCPLFHSSPSPGEKTFLCSLRSLCLNSFRSWLRLGRVGLFATFVVKLFLAAAHRRSAYFSFSFSRRARRTFSGVIGSVFILTPTASKIALLITAAVGSMFNSPSPLAPNGPVGS
jgi:hypothetical protein